MKEQSTRWFLLGVMAFSFHAFAQEPALVQAPGKITVCIGEFAAEGLESDAAWTAFGQMLEALASLQVVVLVQPDKAMLATGHLDTSGCTQRANRQEGPAGILNIRLTRFGPFMRVNLSTMDPTNNAVLWQTETKTGTDSSLADALKNDLNLGLQKISERFPPKASTVAQTTEVMSQPIPEAKTTEPIEQKPVAEDKGKFKVTGVYGRVQATPSNAKKTWGWVAVGVGGALVAGGGLVWGLSLEKDKENNKDSKCTADSSCSNDIKNQAGWGDAMFFTGAAAVTTGILLLTVFADKDVDKNPSQFSFQPTVGPDGVGALVQGRF